MCIFVYLLTYSSSISIEWDWEEDQTGKYGHITNNKEVNTFLRKMKMQAIDCWQIKQNNTNEISLTIQSFDL